MAQHVKSYYTKKIRVLFHYAFELKCAFESDDSIEIIQNIFNKYFTIFLTLEKELPNNLIKGSSLSRHSKWLNHWLMKHSDVKRCSNDIQNICNRDLFELYEKHILSN